jgi:hypothetical protein
MNALPSRLFLRLFAAFALFAFGGDIVADSIVDSRGEHCAAQTCPSDSDHDKTPCSHCSCAVHNGTVITSALAVNVIGDLLTSVFFPASEQSTPDGLPAAIDHPPQLA